MTIIKETRWKCDYCGAVSPVVEEGEKPKGWLEIWSAGAYFIEYIPGYKPDYHFCCNKHAKLHKKKWESMTDEQIMSELNKS